MERSAIILAEGSQGKIGDRGTLELDGKPLIAHVVDAVSGLVDEVIVVTISKKQANDYAKLVSPEVRFVIDSSKSDWPLAGAIAGFEAAKGEYAALLRFDTPIVSPEVLSLLFDCSAGKTAVIPRYTNQEIEPLQAVYHVKRALIAAKEALAENEQDLAGMV